MRAMRSERARSLHAKSSRSASHKNPFALEIMPDKTALVCR